ncbi:MAG: alpha/beta hydrolase [Pseudomonadota bacterium]|nr:alpha/beta hydrolase [Pseudomonadota bacterium]
MTPGLSSWLLATLGAAAAAIAWPASAEAVGLLADCHVTGIRNGVLCGSIQRPLDPAHPARASIDIHFVVVPAMARRKLADPVFMLAGGPGQSAISVAPMTMPLFARLNNRRDIVFVDQRGTGASAPLACKDPEEGTLAEQSETDRQVRLMVECKAALLKLPYIRSESDLGLFTTSVAVQDLEAVRRALGVVRIDVVAASYGTRVALEYLRQFPTSLRRSVLDGVAPPDMALPASFSTDNQAALDALLAACAGEAACAVAHPDLPARLGTLLRSLPRQIRAVQPLSGRDETFVMTRDMVLGAVRGALYSPVLASALPAAIDAAARGEFGPLLGLSAALSGKKSTRLAIGMHLSVVCAEDMSRLAGSLDKPGADFGGSSLHMYEKVCPTWPHGSVPAAFYTLPKSDSPVLVLSGSIDPVTPPRHGARVAASLGPLARQVVVANAGHGVLAIGCVRDVVFRFIDAASDAEALAVDVACASHLPRPPAFEPIRSASGPASGPAR